MSATSSVQSALSHVPSWAPAALEGVLGVVMILFGISHYSDGLHTLFLLGGGSMLGASALRILTPAERIAAEKAVAAALMDPRLSAIAPALERLSAALESVAGGGGTSAAGATPPPSSP